jgi:hypothetical protein
MHQFLRRCHVALLAYLVGACAVAAAYSPDDIYPPPQQAQGDIDRALTNAATQHKNVILDFGGNWCADCHVLDLYFHDSTNAPIIAANFIVVHVNIGRMTDNIGIAERYEIPLKKGVPALAVLDGKGRILFTQKTGEFESMRHMESSAVTAFLQRWKPAG